MIGRAVIGRGLSAATLITACGVSAAGAQAPRHDHGSPTPQAASLTLGQALEGIGAFEVRAQAAADRLIAPGPPPARPVATALLWSGTGLALAGIVGTLVSPTCQTRDADLRCADRRGPHWAYPSMVALGLGALITGAYWLRQDADPEPPEIAPLRR